ncbi:MAG: copper homeostasis protein CutC [Bacteroidia bacterium]
MNLLEICVTSLESAIAAEQGGANRIELCDNLIEGGTTPSLGMVWACASQLIIPIHVLIRPRAGDFCYDDAEKAIMLKDIEYLKQIKGVAGFVIGALNEQGEIDQSFCEEMITACRPHQITFHRAFDVCKDPIQSLEVLIDLGFDILLSSGQETTAEKGFALLQTLHQQAAGRIEIMPGAGIQDSNVHLFRDAGFSSFHMSLRKLKESKMKYRSSKVKMSSISGEDDCAYSVCDQDKVKKVRAILNYE